MTSSNMSGGCGAGAPPIPSKQPSPTASEIVERLRRLNKPALLPSLQSVMADAADEIERLRALLPTAKAMVDFIDDSLDGALGYGRDTVYVRGFSDVEITPDGSLKLSDARAAIAKSEGK